MALREVEVVAPRLERGISMGRRGLLCTEKPLAHTLIQVTLFSVAQLRSSTSTVTSGADLTHQGQDCPAHWAFLPLVSPVPSLAGPAAPKETY